MKSYTFFILLLCTFILNIDISAQCGNGYEQRVFDWEPGHWQDAVLTARDYAIGGTNMTISFSGDFNRSNPRDYTHFNSDNYGGWSFIDGSETLEM
jgi:hypothetical protein